MLDNVPGLRDPAVARLLEVLHPHDQTLLQPASQLDKQVRRVHYIGDNFHANHSLNVGHSKIDIQYEVGMNKISGKISMMSIRSDHKFPLIVVKE